MSAVGASGLIATALNVATGKNRQPGDREKVLTGLISSANQFSSGTIDESDESMSNTMLELFRNHDDYKEERVRSFIKKLHTKNPECGIKQGIWNNPLHMDIFQAFGAPNHSSVHAWLLVSYPGLDNWFVTISIDLQAISKDILEDSKIPENFDGCDKSSTEGNLSAVKHTLDVVDGIKEIWEYKKSMCMSLLELFDIVAKAMVTGNERSQEYNLCKSNCIHFKNDILNMIEALVDKKPCRQKIPYKTVVTKFNINVNKKENCITTIVPQNYFTDK